MDPSETTNLSDTDFAAHMRERRDGRPMLSFVWKGESRLYARSVCAVTGRPTEIRMGRPTISDMTRALRMIPIILVHKVSGTPNHNGHAWNLDILYTARELREFERLVL